MDNPFYDVNLLTERYEVSIDDALHNLSETLKSILGKPGNDSGFLYYTLPIWSYGLDIKEGIGSWREKYPKEFANEQIETLYTKLFDLVTNKVIQFSFSEFVARSLNRVPVFFEINYNESGEFLCKNDYPDKISIDLPKDKLEKYSDENFVYFDYFAKECKKLQFNNEVSNSESLLNEFYKFLCAYNQHFENISQILILSSKLYRTNRFIRNENNERDISYGGLIIALSDNSRLTEEQKFQLSFAINLKYREIAIEDWINKLNRDLTNQTIKSAIAAIMSRNMSHNLGSHVITNAKYQIEKLATENQDPLARQLNGISKLLQYLQERQDFVAVIANDEKYTKGPLNFKSTVFDMIAMDGPAIRHNTPSAKENKYINNYILDNIVRSEGIYRQDSISKTGTIPIEIQMIIKKGTERTIFKSRERNNQVGLFNKLLLSVPYGLNGRQAFLTIIENIIRNSSKHGKKSLECFNENNPLTFSIIFEENKDAYDIIICDNKQNYLDVVNVFKAKKIIDEDGKVCRLNILDENDQSIDRLNKGIKEILICLSWLKGEPYYLIQEGDNNKLMQIIGVDAKDIGIEQGQTSLGYRFSIEKYLDTYHLSPKEIDNLDLKNIPAASLYTISPENKKHLDSLRKRLPKIVIRENEQDTVDILQKKLLKDVFIMINGIKELPLLVIDEKGSVDYEDTVTDECLLRRNADSIHQAEVEKECIWFGNHYETETVANAKFSRDLEIPYFKKCIFREGVSGGNYTHNLIRTAIDPLSYLRIVESALTRIAIVDERLFAKYNGRVKSHDYSIIDKITEMFQQRVKAENIHSFLYESVLQEIIKDYGGCSISEDLEHQKGMLLIKQSISNFNNLRQALSQMIEVNGSEVDNEFNRMQDYLVKKNIYILNYTEGGVLIDLYGKEVEPELSKSFHFLSIHLGLLEKINNNQENLKERIDALCDKYSLSSVKLSTHSGRGGLNKLKMTFIPLSGIDWALDNCKYVLSELFYGERYIPNDMISEENGK